MPALKFHCKNPGREKITVEFVRNCGIIYVWIK